MALREQALWFQDIRAAVAAMKVARVMNSKNLLSRLSKLALRTVNTTNTHNNAATTIPELETVESGQPESLLAAATAAASSSQPALQSSSSVQSLTECRSRSSTRSSASRHSQDQDIEGVNNLVGTGLAPVLLLENYELLSAFLGKENGGAFRYIFSLNKYCAAHRDTMVERHIRRFGEANTNKTYTITTLTQEVGVCEEGHCRSAIPMSKKQQNVTKNE